VAVLLVVLGLVLPEAEDQRVLAVMAVLMVLLKMTVAMVVLAVLAEYIMPPDQLKHTQAVAVVLVKLDLEALVAVG
jgi:hypothetical protein